MKTKLLDCTLRDGGYVNDWNFGLTNIRKTINSLCRANLDYVEIGFLDERADTNINRSLISDMGTMNKILEGVDKKDTKLLAMIDYGTFSIDKMLPKSETKLDGIRVIFKKPNVKEALDFCDKLEELGYYVSANAVMINKYSKEEYESLINEANKHNINTLTFVDTYGIFTEKEVSEHFKIMDEMLRKDIAIGFHSHNSLGLSNSNTLSLLNLTKDRDVSIDGSLYGMGKSAGNASVEVLARYMNAHENKSYDMSLILGLIDEIIMEEYKKKYWGYALKYFTSASNNCHYNYVDYYLQKGFNYELIDRILKTVKDKDRFNYSSEKAEQTYERYKNNEPMKAIIFDVDGTLLDTTEGILASIDYAVEQSDLPKLSRKKKLTFIGPPIHDSFKNAYNLTEEETKNMVNFFRDIYKIKEMFNAKLYEGIVSLLEDLKKNGYKIGIATYKREDLSKDIIKHFGLDKYFDVIKGGDKNGLLTKSEIISACLEEMDVIDKSNTILIGDSMSDYKGSLDNDVKFIGVSYGFGFKSKEDNDSLEIVDSTNELKELILEREK